MNPRGSPRLPVAPAPPPAFDVVVLTALAVLQQALRAERAAEAQVLRWRRERNPRELAKARERAQAAIDAVDDARDNLYEALEDT